MILYEGIGKSFRRNIFTFSMSTDWPAVATFRAVYSFPPELRQL